MDARPSRPHQPVYTNHEECLRSDLILTPLPAPLMPILLCLGPAPCMPTLLCLGPDPRMPTLLCLSPDPVPSTIPPTLPLAYPALPRPRPCPFHHPPHPHPGLPRPPEKDAYLNSRMDRFYAELADYKPGTSRADLDEPEPTGRHKQHFHKDQVRGRGRAGAGV